MVSIRLNVREILISSFIAHVFAPIFFLFPSIFFSLRVCSPSPFFSFPPIFFLYSRTSHFSHCGSDTPATTLQALAQALRFPPLAVLAQAPLCSGFHGFTSLQAPTAATRTSHTSSSGDASAGGASYGSTSQAWGSDSASHDLYPQLVPPLPPSQIFWLRHCILCIH